VNFFKYVLNHIISASGFAFVSSLLFIARVGYILFVHYKTGSEASVISILLNDGISLFLITLFLLFMFGGF